MWPYLHMVITAYMYKNIKAYLYVNMRMCLCVSMQTHKYVHTKTHEHIYGYMCSWQIWRNTFFTEFRRWKLAISEDFVWRTHILLLDSRDSHVASLLWIIMVTHLHFYIYVYYHIYALPLYHYGNYHNTILPRQESWHRRIMEGLW